MKKVIFSLIMLFFLNFFSLYYQWYIKYSLFDQICHLLGGFLVAILFSIYLKEHLANSKNLGNVLIIVGAVTFIGVIWEFGEYIANQTLVNPIYSMFHIKTYFMGDLDDTLNDLLMDIIGAFVFSILYSLHSFRNRYTHEIKRDF